MKKRNLVALIGAGVLAVGSAVIGNKLYQDYKIERDFSSPEFREGIKTIFSDFDVLKHVDFSQPETRTSARPTTYSTKTNPSGDY